VTTINHFALQQIINCMFVLQEKYLVMLHFPFISFLLHV